MKTKQFLLIGLILINLGRPLAAANTISTFIAERAVVLFTVVGLSYTLVYSVQKVRDYNSSYAHLKAAKHRSNHYSFKRGWFKRGIHLSVGHLATADDHTVADEFNRAFTASFDQRTIKLGPPSIYSCPPLVDQLIKIHPLFNALRYLSQEKKKLAVALGWANRAVENKDKDKRVTPEIAQKVQTDIKKLLSRIDDIATKIKKSRRFQLQELEFQYYLGTYRRIETPILLIYDKPTEVLSASEIDINYMKLTDEEFSKLLRTARQTNNLDHIIHLFPNRHQSTA